MFIETMVSEGFSADQIARDMGFKPGEFARRFRDAKLYAMAMSLELKQYVQEVVDDPNKFNFSVLQRVAECSREGWKIKTKIDDSRGSFFALRRVDPSWQ